MADLLRDAQLASRPLFFCALFLALSPFGLALQPISALAGLQMLCFMRAFSLAVGGAKTAGLKAAAVVALILLGSAGWTLGNAGLFNMHGFEWANLVAVFALSTLAFTGIVLLGVLPAHIYSSRFDQALLQPLALPAVWAATWMLISWTPLGSFGSPAYMLLDIQPFALAASLVGLHGLHFVLACLVSAGIAYISPAWPGPRGCHRAFASATLAATLSLLVLGSVQEYHDVYWMRSIRGLDHPLIQASCVFRGGDHAYGEAGPRLLAETRRRVAAGDAVVLWSEAAVVVSPDEERQLLAQVQAMVDESMAGAHSHGLQGGNGGPSHGGGNGGPLVDGSDGPGTPGGGPTPGGPPLVGVTYALNLTAPGGPLLLRNMFVLLAPGVPPLWRYQKAHPVPVAEAGVQAGPASLPWADTPTLGRLGGGICFDLDSTVFMRQAGAHRVGLLLQPSNTWGPIGQLHFRDNALRAAENGFVLLRCSSNGFSGVVTPYLDYVHHLPTFQSETRTFQVPLYGYRRTVYTLLGGYLEGGLLGLAAAVWLLAAVPGGVTRRLAARWAPAALAEWVLGERVADFGGALTGAGEAGSSEQRRPLLNGNGGPRGGDEVQQV